MVMRVDLWVPDMFATGYHRGVWPANASGAEVRMVFDPDVVDDWADVTVVVRPTKRVEADYVEGLAARGRPVVVDVDDDLWSLPASNPASRILDPYLSPGDNYGHTLRACRAATVVTVTTPALAKRFDHAVVLENCVRESDLALSGPDSAGVWWPGAPFSHADNLDVLIPVASRLRIGGVPIGVVGIRDGLGAKFAAAEQDIVATGFIPFDHWMTAVSHIGVGLAPLARSTFNLSKCVDASTRICTERGLIPAGELCEGDAVWRDGWREVEVVERGPSTTGVVVTVDDGRQIRLTTNHRMLVNGAWCEAGQIVIGDQMPMEPEPIGQTTIQSAKWPAASRFGRFIKDDEYAYLDATDGPTIAITPRWGRLLGAFVGDGGCGNDTNISIHCDGQDDDWIRRLIDDFQKVGFRATTQSTPEALARHGRKRWVSVGSAAFLRVLNALDLVTIRPDGRPLRNVRVPEIIWRSPRDVVAAFLAALFETDGTAGSMARPVPPCFTSKYEAVARDVQRLLLCFGIESLVAHGSNRIAATGKDYEHWTVRLRRAGADVFAKEIGFYSERKRAVLDVVTTRPHSNAYKPMSWLRTVTSIEACVVDPVDIQCEGHEFLLTGFVSHNSWLRPLQMAATGVPFVASRWGEYERFGAGVLVDGADDWYDAVSLLVASEPHRSDLAAAGRVVAADWTYEKQAWRWTEAWAAAIAKAGRVHA